MIWLTRLNRTPFVLNAELIRNIDITPDTVIFLTDGQKFVVLEEVEEVVARVKAYKQSLTPDVIPIRAGTRG